MPSNQPLHHFAVPSVEELLIKQYPAYKLNKTFQELRQTHMVVMHTYGSTGLPKPLIWTHETCTQVLNANGCQTPGEIPSVNSLIGGALLAQLLVGAIPYGNVVIAPVASPIPTAQGVVDALKQSPADVAILVPSVVAELAHNEELLDYCAANLKTIIYIGGDLPQDLGDRVASRIYLRYLWGATETGIIPQLLPSELLPSAVGRSLWRYVKFYPCIGAIFDKTSNGIYELVAQRKKGLADMQPCFTVPGMQQLEEYRTKDLFEPHPSIPDLWCWRARSDDIIVFLNGEKTNLISMEQHIMTSNPEVSGALVIGAQKLQAALLIEPVSDLPLTTAEQAALIERIWPSIEESNRTAPAHARVEKSFVLVIPMDRRLIRALYPTKGAMSWLTKDTYSHSAAHVRRGFEDSMKALNTDRIEMFYLHGPDRSIPFEETLSEVNKLHQEGRFERFGISNYTSWEVARICDIAEKNGWVKPSVYQGLYNAFNRSVEAELIPCLRFYNMSLYAFQPLAGGFLASKYHRDQTEYEAGCRFDPSKPQGQLHHGRYINDRNLYALEDILRPVIRKHGLTEAECGLRWMAHHSSMKNELNDAVIVGASSAEQLEQNLKDLEKGELPDEVVEALEKCWKHISGVYKYFH
ncbi:hypothetical protein BTUL_0021g00050 [Botrytis tulipae]|uniref:NADP-dependent oxidoreductase domain-containing protein n=1 Tax=Botrytis tulipae TaxID=87230 RepID=A0A4Z1F0C8_9HELO|nr:hypothetical protein BTUL_0021g00050 [Botrytis tulipae]